MAEIPGAPGKLTAFLRLPFFWETGLATLVFLGSSITAKHFSDEDKPGLFWAWITIAALSFLFACCKSYFQFVVHKEQQSTHGIEGCLHTLHALLLDSHPVDAGSAGLRITVHKPINKGQQLEQVVEYVGDRRSAGKTAGRRFPSQSGIIGQSFREKNTIAADRDNPAHEQYIEELKSVWHYTELDAREAHRAWHGWQFRWSVSHHKRQLGWSLPILRYQVFSTRRKSMWPKSRVRVLPAS